MWKVGIHNCYWIGSGCESMDQVLEASAGSGVDYLEVSAAAMEGLDPGKGKESGKRPWDWALDCRPMADLARRLTLLQMTLL